MAALTAFLIALAASLTASVKAQNACVDQTSSTTTYIANPTSCAAWIACNSGKVTETGICSSGHMFDATIGSCELASKVTCAPSRLANICKDQPDDSYVANPSNCKGYFHCKNSVGNAGLCSPGYYFNDTLKVCIKDASYVCANSTTDNEPLNVNCDNVPNGTSLPDKASSSGYFTCVNGKYVAGSCGDKLQFNPATGGCEYPPQVPSSVSSSGSETKTAISVPYNFVSICRTTSASNQFARDPANCTGYFYCSSATDTTPSRGYCPYGLYFDPINQICAEPSTVTCAIEPCLNKPIGYFAADDTSCSKFYYCSASGKYKGSCRAGYNFDVENQICATPSAAPCIPKNKGKTG